MDGLQSSDAFRYVWVNWRIMGLKPFAKYKTLYRIYAVFITITTAVIPPLQQLAQAFFVDTYADLMNNLSVSLEWACGCLKHFVVIQWHGSLRDSHQYLPPLDIRIQRYGEELEIMERIVKNCHRLYFAYNLSFWSTLAIFAVNGALTRKLAFEGYVPWDWTESSTKYWLAYSTQLVTSGFQLILNLSSDTYALCYVYVLLGHLETLGMRISRIGYDGAVGFEDNYRELIECVHDHRNILHFFYHIRPVISRTIMIQFIVTAFALCLTAFYFVYVNNSVATMLTTLMYITVLFAQVAPVCYFVNTLMELSDYLTTALYSCNWMDQTPKFRKTLIIFMQRTQQTNTIVAGNLAPVTLQTCMKIIRFSFSMFTILTQM